MPHRRVMLVEDDDNIRESLTEFLEEHGYEIVEAVHGRDALAKLVTLKVRPGIIVLDLMMPIMDGRAFREEQLANPALAGIPVVVVSAYKDVGDHAKVLQVDNHLKKPINLKELLGVVEKYCS